MDFTSTELLEAWDWESGRPTGRPVERGVSYREGIPHEGVHLWIVKGDAGVPEILFQRRSPYKALYPDCLDITVGGHVPFGLYSNKIQKESMEELGISPSESDMIDLGYIRYEEVTESYIHREFQHVYIMRDDRPLGCYRFNDGEVTGICAVPVKSIRLFYREDFNLPVRYYDGINTVQKVISRYDFHPLLFSELMKEYMSVVLSAAEELLLHGMVDSRMPGL